MQDSRTSMVDRPLVSVIVPVYNVEDYIEQCVLSIIAQTYRELEIVLVNDGSTDGSGAICDRLGKRDARIVVYHKTNGGLSDARNYGLRKAFGQWISFVDGDDYVSPAFIEVLLKAVLDHGCSLSAVPFGKPFRDGAACDVVADARHVAPARLRSSREMQRSLLYQEFDTGAPWRLYKREVLGDNPFPKGMYYEDLACVYRIVHKVDQIAVIDCCDLYAYRMRSTSIIRQAYRPIKAHSALAVADRLYKDIANWYPELTDAAASRCFSVCRMVFAQVPIGSHATSETARDGRLLWDVLKRHRGTVLHDKHARKRERLAAAVACTGIFSFSLFCAACRKIGIMR